MNNHDAPEQWSMSIATSLHCPTNRSFTLMLHYFLTFLFTIHTPMFFRRTFTRTTLDCLFTYPHYILDRP